MSKTVELARHLETLHINNMYKTDFYWTWDKSDEEGTAPKRVFQRGRSWLGSDCARGSGDEKSGRSGTLRYL